MDNRGKRQSASIFGGMGFYIALLVCAVAAGVVGYYALLSNAATSQQEDQALTVDRQEDGGAAAVDRTEVEPAKPVISDEPVVVDTLQPSETSQPETEASAPVTEDAAASSGTWEVVSPVKGETLAVFSVDTLRYDATLGDWRTHDGLDIQAAAGTAVAAAAAGTVLSVTEDSLLGTMVVIDHHNGYVTTYASLQPETMVLAGDEVGAGSVIGTVGNTTLSEAGLGAHLHFAVSKDGVPVDPAEFLG